MDEAGFDATIALERISEIGKLDEFYEAIDADDFRLVAHILRQACIDAESISSILKEMEVQ